MLILQVAQGLFWEMATTYWCLNHCGPAVTTRQLLELAPIGVALIGWWATCRPSPAWLAPTCAGLVIARSVAGTVITLSQVAPAPVAGMVWTSAALDLVVVGPLALLIWSYLGRRRVTITREPSLVSWLGLGVALFLFTVADYYFGFITIWPLPILMELLLAGSLYGLLRWRWPVEGGAPWLSTTLVLTAFSLPAYAVLAIWPGDGLDAPAWFAASWWIAAATVAVLATLQVVSQRQRNRRRIELTARGESSGFAR